MNLKQFTVFLFFILIMSSCTSAKSTNQVCFKNHCIEVEVVSKEEDRIRGLQNRPALDADKGMLFVFPESSQHTFWMKDTLIPLDIIWMDYAKRVVFIEEAAKPCKIAPCPRYVPPENAMYVLEINANSTKNLGLKVGDVVEFRLEKL